MIAIPKHESNSLDHETELQASVFMFVVVSPEF